jgi:hypothetical protein
LRYTASMAMTSWFIFVVFILVGKWTFVDEVGSRSNLDSMTEFTQDLQLASTIEIHYIHEFSLFLGLPPALDAVCCPHWCNNMSSWGLDLGLSVESNYFIFTIANSDWRSFPLSYSRCTNIMIKV